MVRKIAVAALFFFPAIASAQTFSGRGYAVDGDSLSVSGISIRLFGIDAPELSQTCKRGDAQWPCGREAKRQLQALIDGNTVECRGRGIDDYGRTLAVCTSGGREINTAMVTEGWATAFQKYSDAYVAAEEAAKAHRAGIWGSELERPQDFRARKRGTDSQSSRFVALAVQRQTARGSAQCVIKGNHSRRGEGIYHLPGMPYYSQTRAEEMFCTEAQAQAAGYRRARVRN